MNKITPKNLIIIAVIVGVLVIPGVLVYLTQGKSSGKSLTSQQAGEKVIKYINENFFQGKEQASLVSIDTENDFYKLKLTAQGQEVDAYLTLDGKSLFFQAPINLDQKPTTTQESATTTEEAASTIGNFSVSQDEICKEGDKPIVYFFGSSTCPHCIWEKPVVEDVVSKFKENIVSHINIDSNNDADILQKYDPEGYVPTLVLGCKYYRVGSGEQAGTEQESKDLTALICKITGSQPSEVCSPVQDLINQIP